jgi:hypothetical protein
MWKKRFKRDESIREVKKYNPKNTPKGKKYLYFVNNITKMLKVY